MCRMFLSMLWLGGITAPTSAQTPESTYGHLQETYPSRRVHEPEGHLLFRSRGL
jgi:hypothetical protein